MKPLVPWIIALAALPASAFQTRSATGDWQGSLQNPTLRVVIKITRAGDERLKAAFYSIDQGGIPINASAASQQGSTLKIEISAIGASYEGKLGPDGNSITGTWSQGAAPLPLNLVRATPETAWEIPEPPPPQKPMRPDADPAFEVATIKPSRPDEGFSLGIGRNGSNVFTTTATPLRTLIQFANGIHPKQISNGPPWLDSESYDVIAKPDQEGVPNTAQMRVMVRKLLADRFSLVSHKEKRELSVYAITLGKGGAKLSPHQGPASNVPAFGFTRGMLTVTNATIAEFAGFLQANLLELPVVDQTALPDRFDFRVRYTPDASREVYLPGEAPPPPVSAADAPPDMFTALQQQLGLKMDKTKAVVDVVVIDKVEKPSDN